MAIEVNLNNVEKKEKTISVNVPALSSVIVNEVNKDNFLFGYAEFFIFSKINAAQILIPIQNPPPIGAETGIGNLDQEMVDNNFSSISYNNFGAATGTNLPFYTFDFGTQKTVSRFQINWWQFNNYVPNTFRIEASNDNVNWTTIEDNLTGTNIVGNVQFVDINDNTPYQYWRMFVYDGFNQGTQFIVLTQMIPLFASTVFQSIENSSNIDFFFDANGKINIENLDNSDSIVTLRYRG
ncbi:MAG: discoidin domain-containing protein [Phycisphaerales bacterium]|nr:discoidin domain-containing protein [Phycisphaerales bacterium]